MKFKKGSLSDILWFMAVLMIFIIVMTMQMSFSTITSVDSYAKNIVNAASTDFVASINGFSKNESTCNMYNLLGEKRRFGSVSDSPSESNGASANAFVNARINDLERGIVSSFREHSSLKLVTNHATSDFDVDVEFKETSNSLMVNIVVTYKVSTATYAPVEKGFVKSTGLEIPRKVFVTKTIENPMRFK